jgi:hypothetical protein
MENKHMPVQIIRLPSYDAASHDYLAIAPADIPIEDSIQLACAVIRKKNHEYKISNDGFCNDGLSVEESIITELESMGFGFDEKAIIVRSTLYWDRAHEFSAEDTSILASYAAKKAISAVLSKLPKP